MRLLVQRVKQASVHVEHRPYSQIGPGLLVFFAVHKDDVPENTLWMAKKLVSLRIFEDDQGKMNRSIEEINGDILIVSQFTLYANCQNGRRPDFISSAPSTLAEPIYQKFISETRKELGKPVFTGVFGAYMQVSLINDGPITLLIEKNE